MVLIMRDVTSLLWYATQAILVCLSIRTFIAPTHVNYIFTHCMYIHYSFQLNSSMKFPDYNMQFVQW